MAEVARTWNPKRRYEAVPEGHVGSWNVFCRGQRPSAMFLEELNQRNHPELWRIWNFTRIQPSKSIKCWNWTNILTWMNQWIPTLSKNNGVCCRSIIFKSFHAPPSAMPFLNVMAVISNSRRICRKRSTNFRPLSSLAHFLWVLTVARGFSLEKYIDSIDIVKV